MAAGSRRRFRVACCLAWAAPWRCARAQEAVVRLEDVPRVEAWAFVNSLRGWLAATVG